MWAIEFIFNAMDNSMHECSIIIYHHSQLWLVNTYQVSWRTRATNLLWKMWRTIPMGVDHFPESGLTGWSLRRKLIRHFRLPSLVFGEKIERKKADVLVGPKMVRNSFFCHVAAQVVPIFMVFRGQFGTHIFTHPHSHKLVHLCKPAHLHKPSHSCSCAHAPISAPTPIAHICTFAQTWKLTHMCTLGRMYINAHMYINACMHRNIYMLAQAH